MEIGERKQQYIVEIDISLRIRRLYPPVNPSDAVQIQQWEQKYGYLLSKAATEMRKRITEEINAEGR